MVVGRISTRSLVSMPLTESLINAKKPSKKTSNSDGTSCSSSGLVCLSSNLWPRNITCTCSKTCSELVYTRNAIKRIGEDDGSENNKKSSLRYEILQEKLRYRRDIFFSYEDLIVSFGGAAALLIGFNLLNALKMVYYVLNAVLEVFLLIFNGREASSVSRVSHPTKLRF